MIHNEVYKWFELYFPMSAKTTGGLKPLKVLSRA